MKIEWVDKCFMYQDTLVNDIEQEHFRQLSKWSIQTRSPFEWMTYLTEEVGELAQAISERVYRKGTNQDIYKEAIQVATLALKIAEMANLPK